MTNTYQNTEDQTFRKLKQLPFTDLQAGILNLYSNNFTVEIKEKYLIDNGWTKEEYLTALTEEWQEYHKVDASYLLAYSNRIKIVS